MARLRPKSLTDGFACFFELFLKRLGQTKDDDEFLKNRFIDCDKEQNRKLFGKSVIQAERKDKGGNMQFLVSCTGINYFVTVGYHDVSMPSQLIPEDTTVGIFLTLVLEREIPILSNIDNWYILNKIIIPFEDPANPIPYSLEDFVDCFPEFNVFRINDAISDYNVMLDKLSISLLCKNNDLLLLNLPVDVLNLYMGLVNSGYKNLNYDNLWRSISANEWRYCFIDLYRCIEVLFNITRTLELNDNISSRKSLNNLFTFSWENLRDYYHEDQMLEGIISSLSPAAQRKLSTITPIKNAKGYYALRNSIVHGKRIKYYNSILKKEKDWLKIIDFSLTAIDELYSLYDDELDTFDESVVKSNRIN